MLCIKTTGPLGPAYHFGESLPPTQIHNTYNFVGISISPGISIGQVVVAETYFAHRRPQKMGIWTLAITLEPPMGPFVVGFVIQNLDWRWMYWIMATLNLGS
jgi:MFS family permease